MACPLEEYRINEICVVSVTGKLDHVKALALCCIDCACMGSSPSSGSNTNGRWE